MTAAALLDEAARGLTAAGIGAAEWDAERLIRHVLGWDRATFLARPQAETPPEAEARRVRGRYWMVFLLLRYRGQNWRSAELG